MDSTIKGGHATEMGQEYESLEFAGKGESFYRTGIPSVAGRPEGFSSTTMQQVANQEEQKKASDKNKNLTYASSLNKGQGRRFNQTMPQLNTEGIHNIQQYYGSFNNQKNANFDNKNRSNDHTAKKSYGIIDLHYLQSDIQKEINSTPVNIPKKFGGTQLFYYSREKPQINNYQNQPMNQQSKMKQDPVAEQITKEQKQNQSDKAREFQKNWHQFNEFRDQQWNKDVQDFNKREGIEINQQHVGNLQQKNMSNAQQTEKQKLDQQQFELKQNLKKEQLNQQQ
eukprot:403352998